MTYSRFLLFVIGTMIRSSIVTGWINIPPIPTSIACHNSKHQSTRHLQTYSLGAIGSRRNSIGSRSSSSNNNNNSDDPEQLLQKANQLRDEIASLEEKKKREHLAQQQKREEEESTIQARRQRYSATVPILKADGTVVMERCDFAPFWKDGGSIISTVESILPLNVVLGQSDTFPGAISVDEVVAEGNGAKAGLRVGDLIRAFTACRAEMVQPTWQLMVGGIGQPRTVRFMYSADLRPFEEVMAAITSNRLDPTPTARPVLIVLERRESQNTVLE